MSFDYLNDSSNEEDENENENELNIQESIIFLVDGTKKMYENGSFLECLQTFKDVVRQKCSCNKKDKMGFIIFGTEDTNCEINNVMVLQEFSVVSIDMLRNIKSILQNEVNKYEKLASESKDSLYDVLAYALQLSQSRKKTNTKVHNLIALCTCKDNPCFNNTSEKSRIDHLVATFKDLQIELRVVGLSHFWNDELYYKDLQIISGTCSNKNYKRIYLKDFKEHILYPSRSISTLPWNFCKNISIEVSLMNLNSSSKYPTKIKLEKEENEILEARQILHKEQSEYSQSENSNELNKDINIVSDSPMEYYKIYGDLRVAFNQSEHQKLKNLGLEPGIEILAFKPIICDPINHFEPAKFVTYNSSVNEDSKAFFTSFIIKCSEKRVMPICRIVRKLGVSIAMMIPSEDDGGFYMCTIPFSDYIRNLDQALESFIFNSTNKCPTNEKAVAMFNDLIELSKITYDPYMFTNFKLEKCIAHIEALAFDEVLDDLIQDTTLPPPISSQAEVLKIKLINELDLHDVEPSKKRHNSQDKVLKRTKWDIKELAKQGELQRLTVAELRECLKTIGQSTLGNKSSLINKITNYMNE